MVKEDLVTGMERDRGCAVPELRQPGNCRRCNAGSNAHEEDKTTGCALAHIKMQIEMGIRVELSLITAIAGELLSRYGTAPFKEEMTSTAEHPTPTSRSPHRRWRFEPSRWPLSSNQN
jgi:hypothetical protein